MEEKTFKCLVLEIKKIKVDFACLKYVSLTEKKQKWDFYDVYLTNIMPSKQILGKGFT